MLLIQLAFLSGMLILAAMISLLLLSLVLKNASIVPGKKGIQVIGYLEKLIMTRAQVKERTFKACQASKVVADKQET